jgi:D-xylose transport system substrate-binding protein
VEKFVRRALVAGTALALTLGASACGGDDEGGGGGGSAEGFKIGLLLPETKTARYEAFDKPLIEKKIKELCPNCEVQYQNADQKADQQQSQAEAMLTSGIKVLILDAVDAKQAQGITSKAKSQNIPVVAYDRLATGPVDFYVSFDNEEVGKTQGTALLEALSKGGDPKRGSVVMINGSPTDPNAADFKKGAHSVLDGKVNIGQEYDTPDWSPDKAQQEMEQAITALGKDKIIGVYAANDGTGGGAIAAMKSAGFSPLPPVTGQDAELAAIQRILAGDQYMTVYKAIKPEADEAARMAVALGQGKGGDYKPESGLEITTKNNGSQDVKSVLLKPVAVTKENVKDTVIKDGFYTAQQICTGNFAAACQAAGIS